MTRQKSGVSMMSLQRMLDIKCYKTVWMMGHKIRKAMADQDSPFTLETIVESGNAVTDTVHSEQSECSSKDTPRLRVEAETERPPTDSSIAEGAVRSENRQGASDSGSEAASQGWRSYGIKGKDGLERARLMISSAKDALEELRWAQVLVSNLKGNIRGVHHGVSVKHLSRYLSEFIYRFNRKDVEAELFNRTLAACACTHTVTYEELII